MKAIKNLMKNAGTAAMVMVVAAMMMAAMVMFSATAKAADCKGWVSRQFWKSTDPAKVEACIAQGEDLNERNVLGQTPLHAAAEYNENPAIIDVLVRHGADVNKDRDGWAPLHDAASGNANPAIIDALIRHGAEVNAKDAYRGWTPLHYAAANNDNPAIIDALARHGAKVNARDPNGLTPLHNAAKLNDPAVIDALLDTGADGSIRNNYGNTPFDLIIYNSPLHGTNAYRRLEAAQ